MTGHGSVETAVEAMKDGAFDYVTKPFKLNELTLVVKRALAFQEMLAENTELKARLTAHTKDNGVIAVSPAMRQVMAMAERVADGDATVLIQGESGTGKEVVATAIHKASKRSEGRFIAVNCAAMPEPLLESELFGHVKGAFTGATTDKKGLFEAANNGTILLDEIGAMPMSLQSKLLRVLEDQSIRRVGHTETIPIDVRVLAATNERLEELMQNGAFREDLFYRLNVITIDLPPLRERRDDILPLIDLFLQREWNRPEPLPEIDPEAQLLLERYDWPGNVRELQNALRHACTFVREDRISLEELPARILRASEIDRGLMPSGEKQAGIRPLKAYARECEEQYIRSVIRSHNGDKRKAAKVLKISLATLYRKLPEVAE